MTCPRENGVLVLPGNEVLVTTDDTIPPESAPDTDPGLPLDHDWLDDGDDEDES